MRSKIASPCLCCVITLLVISSCTDDELNSPAGLSYNGKYPVLPDEPYDYVGNPGSRQNKLIALGRVLFYDENLSADNTTACASCHKQAQAFADDRALSIGFQKKPTKRNSMPIQNLLPQSLLADDAFIAKSYGSASPKHVSIGGLFWDGRESELQKMVLLPIANRNEMGNTTIVQALNKVASMLYYKPLFRDAFGENMKPVLLNDQVAMALTSFVMSIKSDHSKYDDYRAGKRTLTDLEWKGLSLFHATYNCNGCHHIEEAERQTPRFANIGLSSGDADNGLARITNTAGDAGKFKVPSLRNVEFTAPYMHDGRFSTLYDVIQHYSDGIADNPNLHSDLKDAQGRPRKMNISPDEASALVAFLLTLSDKSVTTDPKFSDPFHSK